MLGHINDSLILLKLFYYTFIYRCIKKDFIIIITMIINPGQTSLVPGLKQNTNNDNILSHNSQLSWLNINYECNVGPSNKPGPNWYVHCSFSQLHCRLR